MGTDPAGVGTGCGILPLGPSWSFPCHLTLYDSPSPLVGDEISEKCVLWLQTLVHMPGEMRMPVPCDGRQDLQGRAAKPSGKSCLLSQLLDFMLLTQEHLGLNPSSG